CRPRRDENVVEAVRAFHSARVELGDVAFDRMARIIAVGREPMDISGRGIIEDQFGGIACGCPVPIAIGEWLAVGPGITIRAGWKIGADPGEEMKLLSRYRIVGPESGGVMPDPIADETVLGSVVYGDQIAAKRLSFRVCRAPGNPARMVGGYI